MQMKKIGWILAAAAVLAGCENTLEYDFGRNGVRLMASGLLLQQETLHTVSISLSDKGSARLAENAKVTCYVNGTKVAEGRASASDLPGPGDDGVYGSGDVERDFRQLAVRFEADFAPGDEVYLEFEANDGRYKAASPRLTVPGRPSIEALDTTRVTETYMEHEAYYWRVRLTVRDRAGEDDWYCVFGREMDRGVWSFADGRPDADTYADFTLYMEDQDDPVMLDGNMPESDEMGLFNLIGDGSFAVFSDRMFRDRTAELKMTFWPARPQHVYARMKHLLWADHGASIADVEEWRIERRLEMRFGSCSRDTYHYLRALRIVSSPDYMPEIMEPVRIPSNVQGGIGFVGIITADAASFAIPPIDRDPNIYTQPVE